MTPLILAFLLTLPVFHEDIGDPRKAEQLSTIAVAIALAADTPEEAAMLIATGYAESTFGLRYHDGNCLPRECDGGKARGIWQVWRTTAGPKWDQMVGIDNTVEQARIALRKLRMGMMWCKGRADGAMAFYRAVGCDDPRIAARIKIYEQALQALRP